ncbi:MAG: serine/threonine protein kinase [Terriglobia bacterium]
MKHCPICLTDWADEHTTCPTDGGVLLKTPEWSVGLVVRNKYRILGKLGAGGMGIVYKAEHLTLEELRALKVMKAHLAADPKFVRRFREEAKRGRRLRHPSAVHVDDLEQADDGSLFIAMEYVEGASLRRVLGAAGGPLPAVRALGITRQVAEALAAAHPLGMVHRDIKPDNIMLTRDPDGRERVKVLDFGIAALKESGTVSSQLLLTPPYAAPEQWRGLKGAELDGRTDIYALGITLFEILTGRLPFDAGTQEEWMHRHLTEPPPPPSRFVPALASCPALDRLVLKMLAKERGERQPDMGALLEELHTVDALLELPETIRRVPPAPLPTAPSPPTPPGLPPAPPQPTPPEPVAPQPMPPPRPTPAPRPRVARAVVVGGVVVAGLIVAFFLGRELKPPAGPPPQTQPPAETIKEKVPARGPATTPPKTVKSPAAERPKPLPPPVAPSVELRAEPRAVELGQATTLSWSSTHSTELRLEPGLGTVKRQGSRRVSPTEDTTYTLVATGPGGTVSRKVHVSVRVPPPVPTVALRAEPNVVELGQTTRLSWTSRNATDLHLEPGLGAVALKGSRSVSPTEDTTYTLVATGPGGTAEDRFKVTVKMPTLGRLLYEDSFDSTRKHREKTGRYCKTRYGDGGFIVRNVTTKSTCHWNLWGTVGFLPSAVRIELSVRLLKGAKNQQFGLKFGNLSKESKFYYIFGTSGDGSYSLWRRENQKWHYPTGWLKNPVVRSGYGVTNRLAVEVRDNTIRYYVNGKYLGRWRAGADVRGYIGFFINTPGMEVTFDNLRVRELLSR